MIPILYLLNVVCSAGQSALGKQYAKRGGSSSVFNINKAVSFCNRKRISAFSDRFGSQYCYRVADRHPFL